MKKVTILGHFAFGENVLNGQTIKTKIIADELERSLGQDAVCREDTSGGWRFLLLLPLVIWRILSRSQHVIIAPAYKAILLISPLLVFMNFFFHRKLHYVTIGGRLPLVLRKYMVMRWIARRFDAIYVETDLVCEELQEFISELQRRLGTKVTVIGNDKKGRIYIDYYSQDDLDRIYDVVLKK